MTMIQLQFDEMNDRNDTGHTGVVFEKLYTKSQKR